MDVIELEKWIPSKDDPRRMEYAGQPIAREVFQELKYRLESTGYLPDEYFLMNNYWDDGREIPRDADLFCTTDYGGSEGVYLDVFLKWYEDGKPVTKTFITGKTLGENGNDLDRMFLISAAITKAFNDLSEEYSDFIDRSKKRQVKLKWSDNHLRLAKKLKEVNYITSFYEMEPPRKEGDKHNLAYKVIRC